MSRLLVRNLSIRYTLILLQLVPRRENPSRNVLSLGSARSEQARTIGGDNDESDALGGAICQLETASAHISN